MSAFPPVATEPRTSLEVWFVPDSDIAPLRGPDREKSQHGVYSSQTLETSITPPWSFGSPFSLLVEMA
jgi:hypothetical protein